MIKTVTVIIGNRDFIRTFSDTDFKIHKVGTAEVYDEAVDIVGHSFVYEETAEKREIPPTTESEMREALTILGADVP